MFDYTGWIVRAEAGRDRGGLFCVTGVEQEGGFLLLADGKRRRAAKPKRKKLGHVQCITGPQDALSPAVTQKLKQGQPVSDRELRRALCAFKEGYTLG